MKRNVNIINNILSMALTLGALIAVVLVCNNTYTGEMVSIIGYLILGAVVSGFIVAVSHELGHVFAGRRNGFKLYCIVIWFFKWTKIGKKIKFNFTLPLDEAGYNEMIPMHADNLEKRFIKLTVGGIYGPLILMFLGIIPLVLVTYETIDIPLGLFCVFAMLLPMGAYYLFGNILPMSTSGVLNDGAVIQSFKKRDDVSKVTVALLKYQSEMYNGKTPGQVDENLLFDLPQLPEDEPVYAMLLDARYNYFLDKEDYYNAKKALDRLIMIEYLPKNIKVVAQVNALYSACTFDFNEDVADDLIYELERFLNNVNTASTVRAKLAYLLYVEKQTEGLEIFYKKGLRESKRCPMIGLGEFEKKLFEKMKRDF